MGITAPSLKSGKMKTFVREVKKLETVNNGTITDPSSGLDMSLYKE